MIVARFKVQCRPDRIEEMGAAIGGPDHVKPTFRTKCPSLRWSRAPPAQCTMDASRMMARITTTTQKKNTMMPGMAYPATVLALATAASYPPPRGLFTIGRPGEGWDTPFESGGYSICPSGHAGGKAPDSSGSPPLTAGRRSAARVDVS